MTRSFKIRKTFNILTQTKLCGLRSGHHCFLTTCWCSFSGPVCTEGRNSQTHGRQCFKSLKPLIWLVRFASLAVLVAFKKAIKGLLYRDGVGRTLNSLWEEKHWCPVNHHQ